MLPGTKSDMKRVFLALPLSEESAFQRWQSWEPLRSSSVPLVTGGPGHFPSGGAPRILFESLEQGRTAVKKLQKNFIPPGYFPGVKTAPVEGIFKEIVLYESILSPEGPQYHILHKTPLL